MKTTARPMAVVLVGWLVAGTMDITAAVTYYPLTANVRPIRILQGIASGVLGPRAFQGGLETAGLGLALHYLIALIWTIVFLVAVRVFKPLLRNLIATGVAYGLLVWAVMTQIVLPLSNVRHTPFNLAAAIVAAVLVILCIGLPLAGIIGRYERARRASAAGARVAAR